MSSYGEIREIYPRDGLQSKEKIIATKDKVALIEKAIDVGHRRIKVTSFINPKHVPQMADAEELLRLFPRSSDMTYTCLLMNYRGFEKMARKAKDCGVIFIIAGISFGRGRGWYLHRLVID
ncbi:MAG: hypothetical protein K9G26_04590 [Emcibacter sp.]|nr:hypothetical protein [Emcibacter sp.]